jgi:hypothetical protein
MSEVIGKVHQVGETMTVGSAGTFRKRTIVIATNEQYVQYIPIDFVQDKCDVLDNYKVGQEVKVSINIRGNEYNNKYYVSLNGWRIEKFEVIGAEPQEAPRQPAVAVEEESDLPF